MLQIENCTNRSSASMLDSEYSEKKYIEREREERETFEGILQAKKSTESLQGERIRRSRILFIAERNGV